MNNPLPNNVFPASPPRRALVIFTSHPVKEAQRKGLGKDLHQTQAIYRGFLQHLFSTALAATAKTPFDLLVASDSDDQSNIDRALAGVSDTASYQFIEHQGNNFQDKFSYALRSAFSLGYAQVTIIGNDCLDLTPEIFSQTFSALENHDGVIGPAEDGGFYLLGLKQLPDTLFENINWCCQSVFAQICANIDQLSLRFRQLSLLQDIDNLRDFNAWLQSPTAISAQLKNYLLNLIFIRPPADYYYQPFLARFHRDKRYWQLPPPAFSFYQLST